MFLRREWGEEGAGSREEGKGRREEKGRRKMRWGYILLFQPRLTVSSVDNCWEAPDDHDSFLQLDSRGFYFTGGDEFQYSKVRSLGSVPRS